MTGWHLAMLVLVLLTAAALAVAVLYDRRTGT